MMLLLHSAFHDFFYRLRRKFSTTLLNSSEFSIFDKSTKKENWFDSPLDKIENLPEGVLGKAHKDGTIQIKKGLSPAKKKQVLAHERVHQKDFKSGSNSFNLSTVK